MVKSLATAASPGLNRVERRFCKASIWQARRNKAARVIVVTLLVIAVAFTSGYAYLAERRQRLATARRVGAEAQLLFSERPGALSKALLLAAPALAISDELGQHSFEINQLLRSGLELVPSAQVTLQPRRSGIYTINFTPDGKYMVAAGGVATVYDTKDFHEIYTLDPKHEAAFGAVQSRRHFIAAGGNGAVVWDFLTGKEFKRYDSNGWVAKLAFSADGRYLAGIVDSEKSLIVWDIDSGQAIYKHRYSVAPWFIDFSPVDQHLAIAFPGHISLWSPGSKERTVKRVTNRDPIRALKFSSDGRYLLSAGDDALAHVWETSTGIEIAKMGSRDGDAIWAAAISFNGKYLATGHRDGVYRVWDVAKREEVARLNNGSSAGEVGFSPDGRFLLGRGSGVIRVWEWASMREVARTNDGYVEAFGISPNGRNLVAANRSSIRLWRWPNGNEMQYLSETSAPGSTEGSNPRGISVDESGRYLARVGTEGGIWDLHTKAKVTSFAASDVTFSGDGHYVAAVAGRTTSIRRIPGGDELCQIKSDTRAEDIYMYTARLSLRGRYTAVGTSLGDGSVEIWDNIKCKFVASLAYKGNGELRSAIDFSPDESTLVASAMLDNIALVTNAQNGAEVFSLKHDSGVNDAAYNPDGKTVATATDDGVYIWNARTGKNDRFLQLRSADILAYSKHGDYLAAVSNDMSGNYRSVRIWSKDGVQLANLRHDDSIIHGIAFSVDDEYVITGTEAGDVRVWSWRSGLEAARVTLGAPVTSVSFALGDRLLVSMTRRDPDRPELPRSRQMQVWWWKTNDVLRILCERIPERISSGEWRSYFQDAPFKDICKN